MLQNCPLSAESICIQEHGEDRLTSEWKQRVGSDFGFFATLTQKNVISDPTFFFSVACDDYQSEAPRKQNQEEAITTKTQRHQDFFMSL